MKTCQFDSLYMRYGILKLALVLLVAAALLSSAGCTAKTTAESPAPEVVNGTVSDEIAPDIVGDDAKVNLTEDSAEDWKVFQKTYQLALLDEENGGSVRDRADWDTYWYEAPFWFQEEGMDKEAVEAAKMALDIAERGMFEGDLKQLSDLQLLAGVQSN